MNSGFEILNKSKNIKSYILNILIRMIISMLISISVVNLVYSTLNITYDFNTVLYSAAVSCVICCLMYVRFPLLWFLSGMGLVFYYVYKNFEAIKIGILAVFNEGYDVVRNCLGLPYADGFAIIEGVDCSNEVNMLVAVTSVIFAIVVSFFIGRYLSVVFMTVVMIAIISYVCILDNMVSEISVVIVAGCFFVVIMIKNSGFKKSVIQGAAIFIAGFVIVIAAEGVVFDKNSFDNYIEPMEEKSYFEYALRDAMVLKYAEYKNFEFQSNTDVGQLGFFGCVKPVFQDMFTIKTSPVKDKLYLRSFIGSEYKYRANAWSSNCDIADVNVSDMTAKALENADADYNNVEFIKYEQNNFLSEIYVPYYTVISDCDGFVYEDDCNIKGSEVQKYSVKAYDVTDVSVDDSGVYDDIVKNYTNVDAENIGAVNEILNRAGISKNNDINEVENKLKSYFAENYVYDFDSGVVPFGKDFVNYFLLENKKGNFAHFASAAVIAYRALGVPARYVGGYTVGNEQILSGRADRKGEFSFRLNKADFYAWAEVYEKGFGWKVVDISPSPSFAELAEKYDSEDYSVSAENGDVLEEYFKPIENEYYNPLNVGKNVIKLVVVIAVVGILCLVIWFAGRKVYRNALWKIRYNKAENDVKAFMLMDKIRVRLGLDESCDYSDICNAVEDKIGVDNANRMLLLSEKIVFGKGANDGELDELKDLIRLCK